MTESMLTTRLSSVITGCGSNDITCSRRSSSGRTRSMNGITIASPGVNVREYRPRRSTTPARAWGITRTVFASMSSTNSAMTARTIRAATRTLLFDDEGGRTLDLDDVDTRALLEDLPLEVRARRPLLTADADAASIGVDATQHDRGAADKRVRAGAGQRRHPHVPAR